MRCVQVFGAITLVLAATAAWSQASPPQSTGPLGGWRSASNNPGSGSGDMPGASVGPPNAHAAIGSLKGAYGFDLSRRIADAQKLVDEVNRGRMLTDHDTRQIRGLMREDFIAWNKQFDLLPSTYRAERDRWLVDASALTPKDWAQQRLKWLKAQRDWVLAHSG